MGLGKGGTIEGMGEFGKMTGTPAGEEPIADGDFGMGKVVGKPLGNGEPTAGEMAGHEEMADDQTRLTRGGEEIAMDNGGVMRNAGEAFSARIAAELVIGYKKIDDALEQDEGLGSEVEIGFPDDGGEMIDLGHDMEDGREMDGRLAAEPFEGTGAAGDAALEGNMEEFGRQGMTTGGIEGIEFTDAEDAAKIAS
jgi:hypothetical protein